MKNMQTVKMTCPECKNPLALNDTRHGHIFCKQCGLILQDNTSIHSIPKAIEEDLKELSILRDLWRKKLKK